MAYYSRGHLLWQFTSHSCIFPFHLVEFPIWSQNVPHLFAINSFFSFLLYPKCLYIYIRQTTREKWSEKKRLKFHGIALDKVFIAWHSKMISIFFGIRIYVSPIICFDFRGNWSTFRWNLRILFGTQWQLRSAISRKWADHFHAYVS